MQPGHPPVGVAVAGRRGRDEARSVRAPVILVDEQVRGRDETRRAVLHQGDPLLVGLGADLSGHGGGGLGGADLLVRVRHRQNGEPSVRREARRVQQAGERQDPARRVAGAIGLPERLRVRSGHRQHERQTLAVPRPGRRLRLASLAGAGQPHRDRAAARGRTQQQRGLRVVALGRIVLDAGHHRPIRRQGDGVERDPRPVRRGGRCAGETKEDRSGEGQSGSERARARHGRAIRQSSRRMRRSGRCAQNRQATGPVIVTYEVIT